VKHGYSMWSAIVSCLCYFGTRSVVLTNIFTTLFYISTKHSGGIYLTAFWTSYHAYTVSAVCDVFVSGIWEWSKWWDKHGCRACKCCAQAQVMGACILRMFQAIFRLLWWVRRPFCIRYRLEKSAGYWHGFGIKNNCQMIESVDWSFYT
jgi:hypothetical protein